MAKESVLKEKSFAFAIRVIKLAKFLREEKKEFILSKQIVRCGTSIGANIEEASGAQSNDDIITILVKSLKTIKSNGISPSKKSLTV